MNHYILLSEPWKKYFRGTPELLIVKSPSQGILDLLDQEQRLIKTVLDSSGTAAESSDYAELEERLDELKTIIPSAETASGYVPTSSNRSYTYISGNTVYTRRSSSYYNGYYYRTLREKQKSSSPELVRSVQSLVHNASLDLKDLDQRIDALQQMISQWNRRTSEMSVGGTSGIMREANQAYLETLRDFTKSFVELRTDVRKAEAEQARIVNGKSKMLQQWETFETNRLPILHDFLKDNAQTTIEPTEDETFSTPDLNADEKCIMVCTIGQRDLYFEVSTHRHKQHPFVLVDVTPQP
ncbi:hypothetical protein ACWPKO_15610 [Coraliomargarita sp. W4R53]